MTCIIGLVDGSNVYVGVDSAGSDGHLIRARKDQKIFSRRGFLYAYCGSFRVGQVLRYSFTEPARNQEINLETYMARDYVNALINCFSDAGVCSKHYEIKSIANNSSILVVTEGRLFQVQSDFQIAEAVCGYIADGSGSEFALGALYASKKAKPRDRIIAALEAAQEFCTTVREPFFVEQA